ncbi:hypothetical protein NL676_014474 [Syzygium grande]|nr:hypothetical protein NL676_014474 [Syzygium grande]
MSNSKIALSPGFDFQKRLAKFLQHDIESNPDTVYGDGFQKMKRATDMYGLKGTLDYIRIPTNHEVKSAGNAKYAYGAARSSENLNRAKEVVPIQSNNNEDGDWDKPRDLSDEALDSEREETHYATTLSSAEENEAGKVANWIQQ